MLPDKNGPNVWDQSFPPADTYMDQTSDRDSLLTWQEKVYLHISEDASRNRSRVFFKAYLVTGPERSRFNLSNVLKVELVDGKGEVFQRQYHPISEGMSSGNLVIPRRLEEGTYFLRAYTRWMQNYGEAYFAKTPVNITSLKSSEKKDENLTGNVQIFPESGDLVQGFLNRLVIKTEGFNDKSLSGEIIDQSGQVAGMLTRYSGRLYTTTFQPKRGMNYRLRMSDGNYYDLGPVQEQGVLLQVNNMESRKTRVRISTTEEYAKSTLKLTGELDGLRYIEREYKMNPGGTIDLEFSKEGIPRGIMVLKLKDIAGEELVMRPLWMDGEEIDVNIVPLNNSDKSEQELVFKIQVIDKDNKPVQTELSIGINQWDKNQTLVEEVSEDDIFNFTALSGDEDQANLQDKDRGTRFLKDLNLLTQANEIKRNIDKDLDVKKKIVYPFQTGLELVGYAYDMENNILKDTEIQLMAFSEGEIWVQELVTDSQGRLLLEDLQLRGESDLVFRTKGEEFKDRLVRVIPASSQSEKDSKSLEKKIRTKEKKRVFEATLVEIQDTTGLISLKEVVVSAAKVPPKISGPSLYNVEPTRVTRQIPKRPRTIPELLTSIPGVNVIGLGTLNPIVLFPRSFGAGPVLWVVDGIPINQTAGLGFSGISPLVEVMSLIPYTDVDRIEVLTGASAAIFGSRGSGGVLSIYTRTGSDVDGILKNEAQLVFQGYQPALDFDDYQKDKSKKLREASSTIYWNPSLETGEDGTAIVRIPKPDKDLPIKIQVSTITDDGSIGIYNRVMTE